MGCSMPGFSVLHYLPEFVQTYIHWVGDVIQPHLPLLSNSSFAFNLAHDQLFQSLDSASRGQSLGASATVLPTNTQGVFPLGFICLILLSKGLSKVFCSTTVQKHQFCGAWPPLGFHGGSDGKAFAWNAGDPCLIPGLGRSPGEGNGNLLQYSLPGESHGQRNLVGYSP